jgi:GTPase SAR1 family protein
MIRRFGSEKLHSEPLGRGVAFFPEMATHSVGNFDYLIKLIVVGDACAGKSELMHLFASSTSSIIDSIPTFPILAIDFRIRRVEIGGARCKVQIWDTAAPASHLLSTSFCRGAMGIVFAYSVTDEKSFASIPHWYAIDLRARRAFSHA